MLHRQHDNGQDGTARGLPAAVRRGRAETVGPGTGTEHHFIINKTAYYNSDKTIGGLVGVMVDITRIKQMEQELRDSELFFKSITDSANDAIFLIDEEDKIQFWNKAAEKIFGYRKESIINRNEIVIISHRLRKASFESNRY